MSKRTECIDRIIEKTGLSQEEVVSLVDEAFEALEKGETRDSFIRRKISDDKAAIQDQIFNLKKVTDVDADVKRRVEQGANEHDSILEALEGSERRGEGAKNNLDADVDTIKSTLKSRLFQELHDVDPNWHKTLRSLSDEDALHLRMELEEGIGSSKNRRMEALARPIRNVLDSAHARAQKAGLVMRRLENYLPHNWDSERIRRFGKTQWVKRMKAHLDLKKTFPGLDSKQADEVLGKSWENIAHGRDIDIEVVGSSEAKRSSRNARHRAFHFKDASASQAATKTFGKQNSSIMSGVINYVDQMSRDIGVVERFGTTPRENLQRVAVQAHNRATNAKTKKLLQDFIHEPAKSKIGRALDYGLGVSDVPLNLNAAQWNRSVRAVLNMSKLGKATLASVVDLATAANNLRFHGLGLFESYAKVIGEIAGSLTNKAEFRQIAHHLAVGMDGVMSSMQKWTIGDNLSRPGSGGHSIVSRMENFFFKASGLNWWTDTIRTAAGRITAEHLGAHATRGWKSLDPKVKRLLKLYDVDAKIWDDMRSAWKKAGGNTPLDDGRVYMMPEHLRESGLDETLMKIYQGEADYAVLMPNAKTRRLLLRGNRPGSLIGEVLRYMGQFRSFPTAISQKLLGRGWKQDKAGLALLMAQMWGWGYLAMSLKDAAKGKTPRIPKDKESGFKIAMESFMHGGVSGIYGDLVLGSMIHRGGGPIDQLAGVGAGEIEKLYSNVVDRYLLKETRDIGETAAALTRQALGNAPFANLFYVEGLMHYGILNELTEMQNSGSLRRRERRMQEDYQQEYFIKPHQLR